MPTLTGQTPYFEVFDMVASKAFYVGKLGFDIDFASPEVETAEGRFSHFMRLRRGEVAVMLNTAYDSNERPAQRDASRWRGHGDVQLYIDCDDVDALHAELAGRGLVIDPPERTGYGYRAIWTLDPDGYRITFHQP